MTSWFDGSPSRGALPMCVLGLPGLRLWRLRSALGRPQPSQLALLRHLIGRSADTVWGRERRYHTLLACGDLVKEYQRRVPLGDRASLAPYVSRIRDGERDVLWPGRTTVFAISGGTESGGCVVPLSREGMKFLRTASLTPGLHYVMQARGAPPLLRGSILSLPGGIQFGEFGEGTITGEVSGLMAYHAPAWASHWLQALPRHVMLLDDWNRKLTEAARIAIRSDVRAIVMVPSWAPAFFDRIRDQVGAGTAAEAIRRVWPNLRVFFSGGVALSTYREALEHHLGRNVAFLESYSASEGFFAFQEVPDAPELLLHLDSGVFYEFVPVEELGRAAATRHTVGSIEPGVDYALHVTNASGLWSCAVDDVVRFTSNRPPRLRVVGRVREVLDRFGEAMSGEHVRIALSEADVACGVRCLHYHVSYVETQGSAVPRHHWLLEFESAPPDTQSYAGCLDAETRRRNGRYRKRREPGAMGPPFITVIPRGTTHRYLEGARRRLGAQSKLLALSEERAVTEGLRAAARIVEAGGLVGEVQS